MKFEVVYGERTYGTGCDASKYKIHLERKKLYRLGKMGEDISIKYEFERPVSGKSDSWDSTAYVKKGLMSMSKEEALKLAQGVICFLYMEDEYDDFIIECDDGKHSRNVQR